MVMDIGGYILSILRVFFRIPPQYGYLRDRKLIYCKVLCGGINPVDAKRLYGDKLPHSLLPIVEWFVNRRVCGIDFSGVVVSAPPGSDFSPGDEVYGTIPPFTGSFCEYVLAPSDFIALKPKNLSFAEASVIPLVGLTTMQSLEDCGMLPGMHVLVLGASGGTGYFAVQMAKAMGAATVSAVCGMKNEDFVRRLGADEVLCYDSPSLSSSPGGILSALQALAKRKGRANIVFDSVSSHDPRDQVSSYETQIRGCEGSDAVMVEGGSYIRLGGLWDDWARAHAKRYYREI
jgi:NADPH:quinone reductase-like Zn-dependent oxidoreductase